jgi:HlyD family secretion protein
MTKKKGKRKRIIILIIVAVVVVLAVLGYTGWQKRLAAAGKTTYQVVSVARGDVEVKVKGSGTIAPLNDNTVYASVSGTVKQVLAEDGDTVSAGDVIAVFKSDDLESQRDSLQQQIDDIDKTILTLRGTTGRDAIYSSVKGVVKTVYAKEGDSVDAVMEKYGALAIVCPDERMKTVIESDGLQVGDAVTVTVESESVSGVVTSISDEGAVISFEDDDFLPDVAATVSTLDGSVLGEGTVQVESPVYITGRGGTIDKVREDAGDKVSRGGKMFDLDGKILSTELYDQMDQRADLEDDLADVQADIDALTVYAGTDGVISDLDLNEEQVVQEGTPLFSVQSSDALKIDVDIDELDIAGIELNEKASVTFDALPDQTFEGEIVKINPIGMAENDVTNYTVTLSLPQAAGVMIGMSADVEIIAQKSEGVLIIPGEAIQIINGEKYVALESDLSEDQDTVVATHKVTTGITDGVNIEIKEGLAEGDRVAVPQVKDSVEDQMMNFRQTERSDSASE